MSGSPTTLRNHCSLKLRRVRTPREAAFLCGVSGLAFGVAEAVHYSWTYALQNSAGRLGYGDYLTVQTLRLISLPFLHCIWSAIAGYYIGLAFLSRRQAAALVVVGMSNALVIVAGAAAMLLYKITPWPVPALSHSR